MSKYLLLISFVVFGLLFTACDKKGASSSSGGGDVQKVEISAGDNMQFDKKTIEVKPGGKIELVLKNIGKQSKDVMGHNWILLKSGADVNAFAQKAVTAKDTDYIPASESGNILAHTKLTGGGESDTITFDTPPAGTYTYLCSFPGHFATMRGELVVK